jgi:hypothetical protein
LHQVSGTQILVAERVSILSQFQSSDEMSKYPSLQR